MGALVALAGCSGLLRCSRTWSSAFSSATASELLTFNFLFSYILTTSPIPPAIANATKSSASILVLILNCCKGWSLWKRLTFTQFEITLNLKNSQFHPSIFEFVAISSFVICYPLSAHADAVSKNLFALVLSNEEQFIRMNFRKKNWDYYAWPFTRYTEINLLFIKGHKFPTNNLVGNFIPHIKMTCPLNVRSISFFFFFINAIKKNMWKAHAIKTICASHMSRDTYQFYTWVV
jgi:hypothetical protein